jgi:hypothetical protein
MQGLRSLKQFARLFAPTLLTNRRQRGGQQIHDRHGAQGAGVLCWDFVPTEQLCLKADGKDSTDLNTQLTTPKRRVVNGRLGEPGSREPSSAQLNERNDWCCVEHEATGCSAYKVRSSVIIFDQTPRAVAIRSDAGSRRGNSLIRHHNSWLTRRRDDSERLLVHVVAHRDQNLHSSSRHFRHDADDDTRLQGSLRGLGEPEK